MKFSVGKLLLILTCLMLIVPGLCFSADLDRLFKQVEKLNLERQGYVLGKKLDKKQLQTAQTNPVESTTPDTFKFRDNNLFVVAHKGSSRILVIYEQFDNVGQKKVQDMVGDLYMAFDEPTVMAHDKIIYWAWAKKGKISTKEFDTAKEKKKKLDILATVKCVSDVNIMAAPEKETTGSAYYVISSDAVLKHFTGLDT